MTTADNQAMTAAQEELRSVLHRTKEQLESVKAQLEDTQAQLNKANEEKRDLRKKLLEQSMGQHRNWEAPLPLPAGGPLTEEHVASLICESVILKGQLTLMEEAIAERDLQVKQLKAKMGDSVVSFRPQHYQGDDADLIEGKNQDGAKAVDEVSKDLQKKCLELQRKLKAKEKEEQVLVKSLSTENEGLKKSNAQLLKEVTQWRSKCSELLKSSEGPGAGGGGGGPSGAVGEGGTSPLAAQSGGDDANPLISALIWCSVGVALASAFYYYINRGG